MKATIVICRHGETNANKEGRMQGQIDIPVNDLGRKQAGGLREALRGYNFDVCYCSPLSRCMETARIVTEGRGLNLQIDARLMEQAYGKAEYAKIKGTGLFGHARTAYTYLARPDKYFPEEGGETFEELYARCSTFLKEVLIPEAEEGRTILVCTHGGWLCAMLGVMFDIPLKKFWSMFVENCGYCVLEYEDSMIRMVYHSSHKEEKTEPVYIPSM